MTPFGARISQVRDFDSQKFYDLLDHYMSDWRSVKEQLDGMTELLLND